MLWGRTVTSSPSFVFSKTFTSTSYPGKRGTKKQHLSRAQRAASSGPGRDQRHQIPAPGTTERSRSEKLSSTPHTIIPKDPAGVHTHMHTHTHIRTLLCDIIPLPSPSSGSQSKDKSCRMALETREERGQQYTAKKPHHDTTFLSWTASICSGTKEKTYEVLPQKPQFPLAPGS